jgi:putative ABC transport system ATP-binding protein
MFFIKGAKFITWMAKPQLREEIIVLKDVWKVYQMGEVEVPALRGINIEIKKGEFVAITGPSGSGKSTIMNMVGCLDLPTKGNIFLDGKNILEMHESDLAQIRGRKIGFIFQQFYLVPNLSALENVMLPLEFQNMDSGAAAKISKALLEQVDLGDRINHRPSQLSGGQMQRVAVARALSVDPEIILADEPTGNLDSRSGQFLMEFFKKLHEEKNKTIVIVTHDLNLVKYAKRVIHLKDGVVEKVT